MEHQKLKVVHKICQIWYTRASFWNFILKLFLLVLALYSYCGDKKQNTDLFQITCFKEPKNMAVEETSGY